MPTKKVPEKHSFEYESRIIAYNLFRETRRQVRIVVSHEQKIDVHAPQTASESYISGIINSKAPWILKSIDRLDNCLPIPEPEYYEDGEIITYLGKEYRLKIEKGAKGGPELKGDYLQIPAGRDSKGEKIRKKLDDWYRLKAREIFIPLMAKSMDKAYGQGAPLPSLSIRKMRSRWGSCRPSGRITLNIHLIKLPEKCIEYVIMHEICHLRHLNHSRNFYEFLSKCLPDWKKCKEIIDRVRLA